MAMTDPRELSSHPWTLIVLAAAIGLGSSWLHDMSVGTSSNGNTVAQLASKIDDLQRQQDEMRKALDGKVSQDAFLQFLKQYEENHQQIVAFEKETHDYQVRSDAGLQALLAAQLAKGGRAR